jgi:Cytochrome P460
MNRRSLALIIFALGFAGCSKSNPVTAARSNYDASLLGELPANPLQWQVITSSINPADSTMSTLYGNDVAVRYARTSSAGDYPAGSVLALVTWSQKEDPRWFGAQIPERAKSVEFVFVNAAPAGQSVYSYQLFDGAPLRKSSGTEGPAPQRAQYLLSQRAAVLP